MKLLLQQSSTENRPEAVSSLTQALHYWAHLSPCMPALVLLQSASSASTCIHATIWSHERMAGHQEHTPLTHQSPLPGNSAHCWPAHELLVYSW